MDFLPDIEKFKNFFDGTDSKNEISIAVEEAKKYDIFNLISRVSALNLFHQNQTKSVILDTYIEGVLCQTRDQFPSKYTISSGKFRKIINQISDTSLKYSIDPPENMFVQNIMFYGNYRVLNGIDQTPAYNLQHMISVLFAKGIEYPKEFLDATYILVNGMLEISEKIVGGILNTENNHDTDEEKSIMIPSAMELNKYTELVIINGADFRKLFLNRIALRQREDFLVPPEPFRKEDVYPWRFNRELSFTRRPIIIRGDEMIWGNRQLDHMIRFTLGLINNGKLKAHSSKMNSLVGRISDERGAEFNDFIYKILVNFNVFEVYPNISKVNGVYIAENNNTLGDIDVLIIDREYHKIIAAEVKNFNFSKNPYEMHLEYKKMFENTKKKKGYYTKHCRRVDWCNKHIDDFKKQYGLDDGDWRVIGVFILSQPLVSTEIYHKEIKMLTEKELSVSSIRNIY